MPGLNIITSNRLEILAEQLSRTVVDKPLSSLFSPEVIVVQSTGMRRWVSMELAGRNGICANCSFLFPDTFLHKIFKKFISNLPEKSPFKPGIMTFKIMNLLPACTERPDFESLKRYLEDDPKGLKLFQVSKRIADTFNQYLVFRPEMIFEWEEGKENHWQAHLWRELVHGSEGMHIARLQHLLIEKIKDRPGSIKDLPERISIFGISYFPPFYMQVFTALSILIEINFFVMNPCMEQWADTASNREIGKIKGKNNDRLADELHLETGNRLLASMGAAGRDFFALINESDCKVYELFEKKAGSSILSSVQSDILHLKNREGCSVNHSDDTSIQIHSCHSPMREIEILRNNLLAMFEEERELEPKDIIVMTPNIELYAPFVHAVFDTEEDDRLRIPFGIAGQSIRRESRVVDGFLSILDLKESRFGVSQVLALLETPGVKERFGLTEPDIETVERWIKDTGIRWGIDAAHRGRLCLPRFPENTWKAGIERLLLGYAMPGYSKDMFCGILPYDNIEGDKTRILGKFLEFLDRVFTSVEILGCPRTLTAWRTALTEILEQFFLPDDDRTEREVETIQRIFDNLPRKEDLSGFDKRIELEALRSYLAGCFESESFGAGFISGGVTFCAMLPVRSIPFKVICLIGMNHDTFPRDLRPLSFDLIAKNPRPTDRLQRNDDRYFFLETIVSARKRLYISYVGQSIQDNSKIPPSIVVSELLDYIKKGFSAPGKDILEQVVTRHKLQAFSSEYYKGDKRLFSYSKEDFAASSSLRGHREPTPFISTGLSRPPEEWRSIDIDSLCYFFSNPAKFILEKRLGIYLKDEITVPGEREAFTLNGLERYQVEQNILSSRLSRVDTESFQPVQRAMGQLPCGNVGDLFYRKMSVDIDAFVDKVEHYRVGRPLDPVCADLKIAGFNITGRLSDIYDRGLIHIRYAKKRPKDLLKSWIYHLVLCLLCRNSDPSSPYPQKSLFICKDSTWEFSPVDNSNDILDYLLLLYWNGLSKPVHFFPESSFEYAEKVLIKNRSCQAAAEDARKRWFGSDFNAGESKDQYFSLCFGRTDPIDREFQKIAKEIFAPLLSHLTLF